MAAGKSKKQASEPSETKDIAGTDKEKKDYTWPVISGALALLLLISVFSNYGQDSASSQSLGKAEFSLKMKNFIQDTITQSAAEVTIENITEENGLYKFSILLNGKQAAVSYATKDGALLFPQALDVARIEELSKQKKEAETAEGPAEAPLKSDTPDVQLFVMSQCPYGVQAENALKPVLDALKGKIDFELRFIAKRNEDGTFSSLHGKPEVDEDLRQVCVMNVYPNYMDYIICRNADIEGSDWQSCAAKSNMSTALIKTCSEGREGEGLLAKNIEAGNKLGIGSSPTILINTQSYRGERSPDAFLGAICSAFNSAPEECSQMLGTSQTPVNEAPHAGCGA